MRNTPSAHCDESTKYDAHSTGISNVSIPKKCGDISGLAEVTLKSFGGISYISVGDSCMNTEVEDIGQIADTEVIVIGKNRGRRNR